ncbi:MAG TPA: lactonase family protein [Opitutaceae bacterium]|nr:lactonase family protein [Opitutaceae bacterium]
MASSHLIFLGTYTRTTSKGIYAVRLDDDTGALSSPVVVAETANPTWVVLSPDRRRLYAVHGSKAQAIGYDVDPAAPKLTPLPNSPLASLDAANPSHLTVDATGRVLLAANYGDGYVAAMAIHADGTLGEPSIIPHHGSSVNKERQDKPHVHSVTLSPDNRFAIVCDLGLDKIFSYALDAANAQLTPANPPFVAVQPGAGPRHFKFGVDGRHAYAITEMGATLIAFDYDAARGALTPIQTLSTVPPDFTGLKWAAEVRVHPNGKFLYASNRTHDSIAVCAIDAASGRLSVLEIVPSGGKTPRNFSLSPNGKWLVCGHQDSEDVTVFRVDSATGRLAPVKNTARVPMCVCVQFYD